jgi:hypothetical protein
MRAVSQVFTTNFYQIRVKYFLNILVSLKWTSFVEFDLKFTFQGRFAPYEFEVKSDFNYLLHNTDNEPGLGMMSDYRLSRRGNCDIN